MGRTTCSPLGLLRRRPGAYAWPRTHASRQASNETPTKDLPQPHAHLATTRKPLLPTYTVSTAGSATANSNTPSTHCPSLVAMVTYLPLHVHMACTDFHSEQPRSHASFVILSFATVTVLQCGSRCQRAQRPTACAPWHLAPQTACPFLPRRSAAQRHAPWHQ